MRKSDFNAALRHLSETGVFERLEYKYAPLEGGYRVTFVVEETPEMFPVRFDDSMRRTRRFGKCSPQGFPCSATASPPTGPMAAAIGNAPARLVETARQR